MFRLIHVAIVREYTKDHVSLCVFPDDGYVYQSKHVAISYTDIHTRLQYEWMKAWYLGSSPSGPDAPRP